MNQDVIQKANHMLSFLKKRDKFNKYVIYFVISSLLLLFLTIIMKELSMLSIDIVKINLTLFIITFFGSFMTSILLNASDIVDDMLQIEDFLIYASQNKDKQEEIIKLLKYQKKDKVIKNINYIDKFVDDKEWFFKYIEIENKIELIKNKNFLNYLKNINIDIVTKYLEKEMDLIKIKDDEYKEFLSIINTNKKELTIVNI